MRSFMICTTRRISLGRSNEGVLYGRGTGREHSGDLIVDGRVILNGSLEKSGVTMLTRFM
jgi:hypothetical protein